jgi:hypothetical protein
MALTAGTIKQDRFKSFADLAAEVKRADQEFVRRNRDDRDTRLTVVSEPGNPGAISLPVERTGPAIAEIQVKA